MGPSWLPKPVMLMTPDPSLMLHEQGPTLSHDLFCPFPVVNKNTNRNDTIFGVAMLLHCM